VLQDPENDQQRLLSPFLWISTCGVDSFCGVDRTNQRRLLADEDAADSA
jgi:hypothetical protein